MASKLSTTLFATTTRQGALTPRYMARSFATSSARLSDKTQETSFVRRVWADPQMRRIAIGGFVVLAGVESYMYVTYGPKVWASLKGEDE